MVNTEGYKSLKQDVERDVLNDKGNCKEFCENGCNKESCTCFHAYCDKFKWVIERAKHYAEKTGLKWEDILNSWERNRNYWYMNYYQESNQPEIKNDEVKVFEKVDDLTEKIGEMKFRCPSCGGISTNPYECNSGIKDKNKICDWKVFGLFGDLGKGVYVFCKDKLKGELIFMPISWEKKEISKPDCFTPNNDTYQLCKGNTNTKDICINCNLYEDMAGPYDFN